jgi:hypothetical protein
MANNNGEEGGIRSHTNQITYWPSGPGPSGSHKRRYESSWARHRSRMRAYGARKRWSEYNTIRTDE